MFMLMGPMVARVSMLMIAGFRMGMNVSVLVDMFMSMTLRHSMLVRMAMFMFVLMVTFHNPSLRDLDDVAPPFTVNAQS